MVEYAFYILVTATGFVAAGLVASLFQLVTGHPLRFGFTPNSGLVAATGILARVAAGPAIIMRNALRAAWREDGSPIGWRFRRCCRRSGASSRASSSSS